MENLKVKQEIIEACLWLQNEKLVIGTWGNVSVRVENGIIMTPSRIAYDVLQPEDMVTIDYDGNVIDGFRSPTTEREVHRDVYKRQHQRAGKSNRISACAYHITGFLDEPVGKITAKWRRSNCNQSVK